MAKKKSKKKTAKKKVGGRKKQTSLNPQQRKFCKLWVQKQNLADAWLGAGYKCSTRAIARNNACELFRTNPYANEYVAKLIKEQEERLDKNADNAMRELIKIGFSNIQDYIKKGNNIVDLSEIPNDKAAAVESIQVDI